MRKKVKIKPSSAVRIFRKGKNTKGKREVTGIGSAAVTQ